MKKILVANRGEIAVRIINACHELGISAVAIYSTVDADSLHVKIADEAYCIGSGASKDSYLNINKIVAVAKMTNCDGVHPGYGFLSENEKFMQVCTENNLVFIGPTIENINLMSNKFKAKQFVKSLNVPTISGSSRVITNKKQLKEDLENPKIHFPILLKAALGGGGKGIKKCISVSDALEKYDVITNEALSSFGQSEIYFERALDRFKHIEVQILGDGNERFVHLGERNCTLQRNLQKMMEESPSPDISNDVRKSMLNDAVKIAKAMKYSGAGTIEFLYDTHTSSYYFMEMNTRIQVEHGVSESVSGVDIVKEQIKIANNSHLDIDQTDINLNGHAIECRITATDPQNGFFPNLKQITSLSFPMGLPNTRVDSYIYTGYTPKYFYDALLSKIIVKGSSREEAISKARVALSETNILGPKTNQDFISFILRSNSFCRGDYNNQSLNDILQEYLSN